MQILERGRYSVPLYIVLCISCVRDIFPSRNTHATSSLELSWYAQIYPLILLKGTATFVCKMEVIIHHDVNQVFIRLLNMYIQWSGFFVRWFYGRVFCFQMLMWYLSVVYEGWALVELANEKWRLGFTHSLHSLHTLWPV